jgi:hypothetical protein
MTGVASVVLSEAELGSAERRWRRGVSDNLDAGSIATEIDYWSRQRALWQGDLEAEDFTELNAATLRAGVAYAEQQLADLTRHAERHARAMHLPGYPRLRPQEDRTARFQAAKWCDLVDLVQTLTGQTAIKRGSLYLLRCPLHEGDRDPSLTIYPPPRGWWCFGCQRGGDAVAFVAELQRCSIVEALEIVETLTDTYPQAWGAA